MRGFERFFTSWDIDYWISYYIFRGNSFQFFDSILNMNTIISIVCFNKLVFRFLRISVSRIDIWNRFELVLHVVTLVIFVYWCWKTWLVVLNDLSISIITMLFALIRAVIVCIIFGEARCIGHLLQFCHLWDSEAYGSVAYLARVLLLLILLHNSLFTLD